MAPIKFEENIKDKLEQRALNPSPDAWRKLSDRLDAEPKNKRKKAYWRFGIAASFVGLLIVASIFFSKNQEESLNETILVEEEIKNPLNKKGGVKDVIVETQKVEDNQVVLESVKKDIIKTEKPPLQTNKPVLKNKSEAIVLVEENTTETQEAEVIALQETIAITEINDAKAIKNKKIDEVVAQIQKLQKERTSVTDAEIDALLNQAQEELNTQRLYNDLTKVVDAKLLLQQVETDLDQSFRDRVFEALKSSYKKVRTAVAERNN